MNVDYVIVGAGLAGGILARCLAEECNKKVLIIERRDHVAGNTFDEKNEKGIRIQKYGPHVVHTNNEKVYDYLKKFCKPIDYRTKCEAVIDEISTPSPFNFKTIDQFYSIENATILKNKLLDTYKGCNSVTIVELLESEDDEIRKFAEFLFEKDYRPYTAKQWNVSPKEIDPSVLKRVPIVLSYGDTYFYDKYEFIPDDGFVATYSRIINHPNIQIILNEDALSHINIDEQNRSIYFDDELVTIIYTGAIDELFNYKFGVLPYRSLYFRYSTIESNSFQNVPIVAHPQVSDYTRITEYKKMPIQRIDGWTTIAYEYPVEYNKNSLIGNEPYYPVLTDESQKIYETYKRYADGYENLILCGRLAEFKYYNMDQVILRAFEIFENMEV